MAKKGEQHHDFLSNFFWFTLPKKFVREPFCVPKNYLVPKSFLQSRRASRFCQSLLSHIAKSFKGETINVSEDLGHQLFLCINGQLHDFLSKKSVSECRKRSYVSRPLIEQNSGIEKLYAWYVSGGKSLHFFIEFFLSHIAYKVPSGSLLYFKIFRL